MPRLLPSARALDRTDVVPAAILCWLGALAIALGLAAGRIAADWSDARGVTATLQILAPKAAMEAQARAALDVLRTTGGIRAVRMIEVEEQQALLAPWLGTEAAFDALPLPLLIEVTTDPAGLKGLETRLAAEAPGAVFDDHGDWRRPLATSAERLRIFAFATLAALAFALTAGLAASARATIAGHAREIETLALVGTPVGFAARLLARPFACRIFIAGTLGTGLAMGLLALLPQTDESGFFLVGIGLRGWHWILPCVVPFAAAALAWLTMRAALRHSLYRPR